MNVGVESFLALPGFAALAICSVLLVLKMGAVAFVTANVRRRSGVVVNPEDARVNPGSHVEAEEAPATLRAKRVHLNDVENIPAFLILATIFTLSGASSAAAWSYFGTYLAMRTLHTICYFRGLQPWRTAAFGVGQLVQLGMMVQLVLKVF